MDSIVRVVLEVKNLVIAPAVVRSASYCLADFRDLNAEQVKDLQERLSVTIEKFRNEQSLHVGADEPTDILSMGILHDALQLKQSV